MQTFALPVAGLQIPREWRLGRVIFQPAGVLLTQVVARTGKAAPGSAGERRDEEVTRLATEWAKSATAHAAAEDPDGAAADVREALAVVRFLLRHFVELNVDFHKVGLAEEIAPMFRDVVVLREDGQLGSGWHRIDGVVDVPLDEQHLDEWIGNPVVIFLSDELAKSASDRSSLGRRALTALQVLDRGFLALNPTVKVLFFAIAVEVMLSVEDDEERRNQRSFAVARRIAYLGCDHGCGREEPPCPFIESIPTADKLVSHADELSTRGEGWGCPVFLMFSSPRALEKRLPFPPVFSLRNKIAHEGETELDGKQVAYVRRLADSAIRVGLQWFASHTSATVEDLDKEIDGAVAAIKTAQKVPSVE
jgi:hypothetical protein